MKDKQSFNKILYIYSTLNLFYLFYNFQYSKRVRRFPFVPGDEESFSKFNEWVINESLVHVTL